MKKTIKIVGIASVAMLSAAAFAGKSPDVGSGSAGTGSVTTATSIATAVAAVAGASAGVIVAKSPSGVLTISPAAGGGGGVTFGPVPVTVGGASFTVSADGGVITVTPVADSE
ncbi:MAG: hypothetical protein ACI91G_000468 [Gammaproteobacteria bacterium]|jgi:hypothetical protein